MTCSHFARTRIAPSTLALCAALTLAGCGRGDTPAEAPPPIVTVAAPTVATAGGHIELTGVVVPSESIDLVARVSGTLLSKGFQNGDAIGVGQTLFRLDPAIYAAEHAVNQARLHQAEADDARQQTLAQADATAPAAQDAARSTLGQARASSRLSGLNLSYATIRAPFSGWIGASEVDVGAYVSAGTKLATLQKINQVRVEFSIGEQALLRLGQNRTLTPGTSVQIGLAGAEDFPITGRLESADPGLSPDTGSLPSRALVANPDATLRPGMFVRVRLPVGAGTPAMMLSQAVIQSDPLGDYVLVVGSDGQVARRDVMTGDDVGTQRVILSGLTARDRVITSGLASVGVGDKVEVRAASQGAAR